MIANDHMHVIAFLSDAPVFLYPLLLVVLYLTGILNANQQQTDKKNTTENKKAALYLFSATVSVFIINHIIKFFFQRPRPYEALGLPTPTEELSLSNIPTDSFPSDHAAVSATIAM
jgi:membrane-associated phospholipid phosphatase